MEEEIHGIRRSNDHNSRVLKSKKIKNKVSTKIYTKYWIYHKKQISVNPSSKWACGEQTQNFN